MDTITADALQGESSATCSMLHPSTEGLICSEAASSNHPTNKQTEALLHATSGNVSTPPPTAGCSWACPVHLVQYPVLRWAWEWSAMLAHCRWPFTQTMGNPIKSWRVLVTWIIWCMRLTASV